MALGYPDHEVRIHDQEAYHDRDYETSISSWIDSITSVDEAASGPHTSPSVSRLDIHGSARDFTPIPSRVTQAQTRKEPADLDDSRRQPMVTALCYRLSEHGVSVLAEDHPFACVCARDKHFHAADPNHVPPLLAYATLCSPIREADDRERYLNIMMDYYAETSYPLDQYGIMAFNPGRQAARYDFFLFTPLALEPMLTSAAGISTTQDGKADLFTLQRQMARIYHMIDGASSTAECLTQTDQEKKLVLQVFYCVTIVCLAIGDLTSWHRHMASLHRYIEAADVMTVLDQHELTKMRKIDIEGSIFAGTPPSLPYARQHRLLPSLLPTREVRVVLYTLRPRLLACKIDGEVTDAVIAACLFIWTLRMSHERGFDQKFDPENVMEDYDFLQRDLLNSPQPLRNVARNPISTPGEKVWSSPSSTDMPVQPAMTDALSAFEEAVRVAALMCLRAALINTRPWSKHTYASLLTQLVDRLQVILDDMHTSPAESPFVDPSVFQGYDDLQEERDLPFSNARPFLIWMSLIGYELSRYYGIYHQSWTGHNPEACVFRKTLRALGICDETDINACNDDDLVIYETMNLNWATGNDWKGKDILRWVMM